MDRRSQHVVTSLGPTLPGKSGTVIDAKMSLGMFLRSGRANKGFEIADVAKITKIQPRILERLEAGKLEGLPADVFVRGFVRNFAKCVGLDEAEALARYAAATGAGPSIPAARAFIETMQELAPSTAGLHVPVILVEPAPLEVETDDVSLAVELATAIEEPAVAPVAIEATPILAMPVVESSPIEVIVVPAVEAQSSPDSAGGKKKRTRRPRGTQSTKAPARKAAGTPPQATPVVVEAVAVAPAVIETVDAAPVVETAADDLFGASIDVVVDVVLEPIDETAPAFQAVANEVVVVSTEPSWAPKMPTVTHSSVPWRRPAIGIYGRSVQAPVVPSLVIDDSDPDSAERELEERVSVREPARKSFLPPILADRAKHAQGQGTLTLAVIILLIAATLTLSYLMRRPSSSGDGVTRADGTSLLVG